MTIISRKRAKFLISDRRAEEDCVLKPDAHGDQYIALTRYDIQRVDHYRATPADIARLDAKNGLV